jgi:hypothetical protein
VRVLVFACALAGGCGAAPPLPATVATSARVRGDGLTDLALAWRRYERFETLLADGPRLVAFVNRDGGERPVELIDPGDGYASPPLVDAALRFATSFSMHGAQLLAMSLTSKQLTLFDRPREDDEQLTIRWTAALGEDPIVLATALDRERAYAAFFDAKAAQPVPRGLAAFAASDGAERWRRELPEGMVVEQLATGETLVAAGRLVQLGGPTVAYALGLDPATGATRWTYGGGGKLALAVDDEHVVFVRADALVVVDRRTGVATELAAPVGHLSVPNLALVGGVAYLASWLPDATAATVFAYGLADHRLRWRRAVPLVQTMLVTARAVYVLTTGGVLHAFERESGAPRWEWGLGNPRDVQLLAGRDPAREQLYALDAHGIRAFAAAAMTTAQFMGERAVIRGRLAVACGRSGGRKIGVGDAIVTTDAAGRFEARVTARGAVHVRAQDGFDDGVDVQMIGRGAYVVGVRDIDECHGP